METGKRSENFTEREKMLLIEVATEFVTIIDSEKTDGTSVEAKKQAWMALTNKYNAVSETGVRTEKQLHSLYDNLKKKARKNLSDDKSEIYKTGGGTFCPKTTAVDEKIVALLTPQFKPLPNEFDSSAPYYNLGKLVAQKWKSMRDEWMRCHRKLSESSSGSGAKLHKYTYYDNMKFLSKIAQHRDTESNMQPPCNIESDDSNDTLIRKRKKEQVHEEKDLSAVDRRMIQFIDSMQTEEKKTDSRIMSFFKSIAPTIEEFSDDEVVEFQYQVISILRNFKQRNINSKQESI